MRRRGAKCKEKKGKGTRENEDRDERRDQEMNKSDRAFVMSFSLPPPV